MTERAAMGKPSVWRCRYCPMAFGGARSRSDHELEHQHDREAEVFERVLDQGMEIVVLCYCGLRHYPEHAYLMRFGPSGSREAIVEVPIPVSVRDDVKMPRVWPERPMDYGRH